MERAATIAVVTRETRLQGLLARWGTRGAARFRIKAAYAQQRELAPLNAAKTGDQALSSDSEAAGEFAEYEDEDSVYQGALGQLRESLDLGFPVTIVGRQYLPTYDFRACLAVVVVGQDGLVANAAKYVGDVPIVAVNPDPERFDGQLLPFQVGQARAAVQAVLRNTCQLREVSLAEAVLNDGQRLLAFNDLFIGCSGHASARYNLSVASQSESQSSSGMIVSTGAGSTGWLSSMFNMYAGFSRWLGGGEAAPLKLDWEDPRLAWVVREPFRSKQSEASLVAGLLDEGETLQVESLMPSRGVIFSDGVENDFLEFNSGSIASIRRAAQRARLVVKAS